MAFTIHSDNSAHKLILHEIEKLVNDLGINFRCERHDIDYPSIHERYERVRKQNLLLHKELSQYKASEELE